MRLSNRFAADDKWLCGVAAALADKLGFSRVWTRGCLLVAALFHPLWLLLAYVVLAVTKRKWAS